MHIQNFDPYDFSKKEIEGVPIYWKNLSWAPCIHIQIAFNTGAFDDPVGQEGLSHFLEHMIFDGCPSLPDKKSIVHWEKMYTLNSWNARTSHYNTVYHLRCLPEHLDTVLTGMKDMIFHPHLRAEDVEHERSVITQEAWGRYLNEKYLQYSKEIIDILFHGHEHARIDSPLGWPDTIAKISQDQLVHWHKEKYARGNFQIVITGAVEEKDLEKFNDFLKDIPEKAVATVDHGSVKKPKISKITKTADEIGEVKEQVEISYLRISPPLTEKDIETVSMFRRLTHDLLFERLRTEKALCYGINISSWSEKDCTQTGISLRTDEKNIDVVNTEFWNILEEIKQGKHMERFQTIRKLGIDQVRSEELSSELIVTRVLRSITRYDGHITPLPQRLAEMAAVTYEDVAVFTKEIFDPEYTFTEIILPSKK